MSQPVTGNAIVFDWAAEADSGAFFYAFYPTPEDAIRLAETLNRESRTKTVVYRAVRITMEDL